MNNDLYLKDDKIDVSDEGIIYWSEKLGCREQDLKNTINRIGNKYTVVVLYMELNRLIPEKP